MNFEWIGWFIPAITLLGGGFILGMLFAERMGPSYKWRWKHDCHHGEAGK